MKIQLEDVDVSGGYLSKKISIEKDYLEDDLTTITRINELAKMLVCPHQVIKNINIGWVFFSNSWSQILRELEVTKYGYFSSKKSFLN